MKRDKQELMRKVKALAEQGFGGEAENAQKLLKKLIDQYGPLEGDADKMSVHTFRYKEDIERMLLGQIIYTVTGRPSYYAARIRRVKELGLECTEQEAIEIETRYVFYSMHFKKELGLFYRAYIHKNNLFHSSAKVIKAEESEENLRIMAMMQGIDTAEYRRMIEA